ncbi:AraC family transcriptional regulator [bacterium 1XD8-76]|nr:AraC family transcriptional regulator [bacterium 1XD8-76]
MALQKCTLNLNPKRKELNPHGTLAFPCAGYSSVYTDNEENAIPWHWHEELEIIYVAEGRIELKIPSRSFYIEEGNAFVINSNILHYGIGADHCHLYSLVFSPLLVTGNEASVFAQKYIQPLISSDCFTGIPLLSSGHPDIIRRFLAAFDAMQKEPAGFEFTVRENLSRICFSLSKEFEDTWNAPEISRSQDNLRIRKMLEFIHKNYSADISLAEIARAADIGERECLRCFRKTIQLSPIQYLLKYRIMQGAEMLLCCPENSISEIASSCGFDSPSNFAATFKRFYNRTPREYRKNAGDLFSRPSSISKTSSHSSSRSSL